MILRPVRAADAPAVVALLNPIIEAGIYSAMRDPITEEDQADFIAGLPPRGLYTGAWSPDGAALWGVQDVLPSEDPEVGEVSTFVALTRLRRGVGRRLMEHTLPSARSLGYRRLRAVVRRDNPGALNFYRRFAAADPLSPKGNDGDRVVIWIGPV